MGLKAVANPILGGSAGVFTTVTADSLILDSANRDVILVRDGANALAQRNGTTGQSFRVYNTFTDASNYERLNTVWSGNALLFLTQQAGTGTARSMTIGTSGSAALNIRINNTDRWGWNTGGDYLPTTTTANDIGAAANLVKSLYLGGKAAYYNAVATAGWGVPAINGYGRATAQVAANASVATYTVGAADGSFEVSANVNVTTATTHSFSVTVAYTDETNVGRTLTLGFTQLSGATLVTLITNVTGAGPYESPVYHIRAKAATAITIATTGTFTTVAYNVEGAIKQTA